MNLLSARIALRERSLLDVLDLAVRFCAVHVGAYAKLSSIVLLPAGAASWAVARAFGWPAGWATSVVLTALADAPFVLLASRLVFDDEARIGEVRRAAGRALPRVGAVRLVQALSFVAGALTGGLSWLYVGPVLLFVGEAALLERAGVGAAIARSRRLALAHFGASLAMAVLLLLARGGAAVLADVGGREVLENVLEVRSPVSALHAGGSALALLGWWATVPWLATARFFVYLDFRTRSEGWDIQTRFAAIAARGGLLARPESPKP